MVSAATTEQVASTTTLRRFIAISPLRSAQVFRCDWAASPLPSLPLGEGPSCPRIPRKERELLRQHGEELAGSHDRLVDAKAVLDSPDPRGHGMDQRDP